MISLDRLLVWAERHMDWEEHLGKLLNKETIEQLNGSKVIIDFRSHSFNVHTPLKKEKIQDPPVEHDLYVTLEEINTGCVKKMKISRRIMLTDDTSKKEDKYVSISVKPGWKSGTKVTFQKEGDQAKGKIPADIVFIIRDKPHSLFRREGSDLRYTARLTLKQVNL